MSYELTILLLLAFLAVTVGFGLYFIWQRSAAILDNEKLTFGELVGIVFLIPFLIFYSGMNLASLFMEIFNEHGVLTPELSSATLISGFFFAIVGIPVLCGIGFLIQVLSRKWKARRAVDEWEAAYLEGRREEE